jgi:peptide chain release factor 1
MLTKINEFKKEYEELNRELSKPEVISDQALYRRYAKKQSELGGIVGVADKLENTQKEITEIQEMLKIENDPEMKEYLEKELANAKERHEKLTEKLKMLMIPTDPNDEKDVIVEIRAGTGGDEAAIFGGDLFRMYTKFAEKKNFKMDVLNSSPSDMGGFKEVIFEVSGHGAYSIFKYESGVHRVQRVPETESSGRIHTSAATVAVLPEAEEVDVEIDPNELRIDIFRSSGPGGQSVNTTDSAVRITHEPTGIVVSCQDEKSQLQNKVKAMKIMRARIYEKRMEAQAKEQAEARRIQIGSGDRSEKIRTYNFPQNRITDHRIGYTSHNLGEVLDGRMDELVESLSNADKVEKLKS